MKMGSKTSSQLSWTLMAKNQLVHWNKTDDVIYLFIYLNLMWRHLQFHRPTSLLAGNAALVVKGAYINWVCFPPAENTRQRVLFLIWIHVSSWYCAQNKYQWQFEWDKCRDRKMRTTKRCREWSEQAWVRHRCWGVCYMLWSLSWDSNP